jgi:hypothetical protein
MISRFISCFQSTVHDCVFCGEEIDSEDDWNYTTDHLVPKDRGGSDKPDNLRPACRDCNQLKGKKSVEEWLKETEEAFEAGGSSSYELLNRIIHLRKIVRYVKRKGIFLYRITD